MDDNYCPVCKSAPLITDYCPNCSRLGNSSGIMEDEIEGLRSALSNAGLIIESLRQQLAECEREREIDEQRVADLMAQVGDIAKERDELVSRIREFVNHCNEHERGWYSDGVAGLAVALTKLGADKTGEV